MKCKYSFLVSLLMLVVLVVRDTAGFVSRGRLMARLAMSSRLSRLSMMTPLTSSAEKSGIHVDLLFSKQTLPSADNVQKVKDFSIKKPLQLPVWPIWSGVIAQVLDWVQLNGVSQQVLLPWLGGRVIPHFLLSDAEAQPDGSIPLKTSPFLLLVHHRHSFWPVDPIRSLTKLLIPEGFPAHAHAGFDTVTITLRGGLRHRDSEGIKLQYGNGDVQWMKTGRGMMHEEMWHTEPDKKAAKTSSNVFEGLQKWLEDQQVELFQIWVDVPTQEKEHSPALHMISKEEVKDVVISSSVDASKQHEVRVIQGSCKLVTNTDELQTSVSSEAASSPIGMYLLKSPSANEHIRMSISKTGPKTSFSDDVSMNTILYVRRGSCTYDNRSLQAGDILTIQSSRQSDQDVDKLLVDVVTGDQFGGGCDLLLLTGMSLPQQVYSSGACIHSNLAELQLSQTIFNTIGSSQGVGYWSHLLSDQEWLRHIQQLNLQGIIKRAKSLL